MSDEEIDTLPLEEDAVATHEIAVDDDASVVPAVGAPDKSVLRAAIEFFAVLFMLMYIERMVLVARFIHLHNLAYPAPEEGAPASDVDHSIPGAYFDLIYGVFLIVGCLLYLVTKHAHAALVLFTLALFGFVVALSDIDERFYLTLGAYVPAFLLASALLLFRLAPQMEQRDATACRVRDSVLLFSILTYVAGLFDCIMLLAGAKLPHREFGDLADEHLYGTNLAAIIVSLLLYLLGLITASLFFHFKRTKFCVVWCIATTFIWFCLLLISATGFNVVPGLSALIRFSFLAFAVFLLSAHQEAFGSRLQRRIQEFQSARY